MSIEPVPQLQGQLPLVPSLPRHLRHGWGGQEMGVPLKNGMVDFMDNPIQMDLGETISDISGNLKI